MYVPAVYQPGDPSWAWSVIRGHPLATLISNGPSSPFATHLPMIIPAGPPPVGDPAGSVLLGHMNRANPHWRALIEGSAATAIFTGPHGYVTPTVYSVEPAAPTWDFVSVHLNGTVRPIVGLEETLTVVRATVAQYETAFGDNWDPGSSLDYFRSIVAGVGAFRFEIESADSMFKLSQDKSPQTRARVIERFSSASSGTQRELACLMRRYVLATGDEDPVD
jgi:transcriptional regulator